MNRFITANAVNVQAIITQVDRKLQRGYNFRRALKFANRFDMNLLFFEMHGAATNHRTMHVARNDKLSVLMFSFKRASPQSE